MNLDDTIRMLEYVTDERDKESIIGWLKQTQTLRQEIQKLKNDNNNLKTQLKNYVARILGSALRTMSTFHTLHCL